MQRAWALDMFAPRVVRMSMEWWDAIVSKTGHTRTTLAYDRQQLQEEGEPGAEVETEEAIADEELPGGVSDEGERGEGLGL